MIQDSLVSYLYDTRESCIIFCEDDTRHTREEDDTRHTREHDDNKRHDTRQQRCKRREIRDIVQDEIRDMTQDMKLEA